MAFEVSSRADLAGLVWDLRDRAYDNPDPWWRIEAECVWQALAEVIEAEEEQGGRSGGPSWSEFARLLVLAADKADLDRRRSEAIAASSS